MNKAELILALSSRSQLTPVDSERFIRSFLKTATETLSQEGRLPLKSFGVLTVVERKKRMTRNPRTNEPMVVPACKVVRFRISSTIKVELN